jgi:serine phosphatase RsbU (regulator of sigma subunit)
MDMEHCMFGEERLRRVLLDHCHASAEDIAEALEQAVNAFAGATPPSDDITFVIARYV